MCPVATGNCLCRKLSPQSSLMMIDGQKYNIFWSLAGAGTGPSLLVGPFSPLDGRVVGSLPSLLGPTLPHP